jgi:hypothetical protein
MHAIVITIVLIRKSLKKYFRYRDNIMEWMLYKNAMATDKIWQNICNNTKLC